MYYVSTCREREEGGLEMAIFAYLPTVSLKICLCKDGGCFKKHEDVLT